MLQKITWHFSKSVPCVTLTSGKVSVNCLEWHYIGTEWKGYGEVIKVFAHFFLKLEKFIKLFVSTLNFRQLSVSDFIVNF